ncbi:MAG: translational GTPase TypA [Chloroflexota bacterium]
MSYRSRDNIRNIAIIAHVDHGKTTLVDGLLKQSNVFRAHELEGVGTLILDSNELEREKGITILAKNTAITYHDTKINVIDTPGHADFSGEVERVLTMADGCLLLVDAVDGPMPQTRFVLRKAFAMGLSPIVVINKVDRPTARPDWVLAATQDLFLELATDAEQLDFPVLYTIAREGRAGPSPDAIGPDLQPLFEAIVEYVPAPVVDLDAPFQMLVTNLGYDNYVGRLAIGRIVNGSIRPGDAVACLRPGGVIARGRVALVYAFQGLHRAEVQRVDAGDIVAITGLPDVAISDTLAGGDRPEALPPIAVEEPTVKMTFGVNTSPLAGREGRYVSSRQLRERLLRELQTNVGLRVEDTDNADVFTVAGRGELHLAILIETMRREGFEFQVSRPEVITREVDGRIMEPVEHLIVDTQEAYIGFVTEALSGRLAQMINMHKSSGIAGTSTEVRLEFTIPTRGLIGFRNAFLTGTRGNGVLSSLLLGFEPWHGPLATGRNGALVASEAGTAVTYGLLNAQERGITFIPPGSPVYEGMIVGLQQREGDMLINPCKNKQKTNIRSAGAEIDERLTPATILSLEQSLDFLEADELLEVTPQSLRLRKRLLNHDERARARKSSALAASN